MVGARSTRQNSAGVRNLMDAIECLGIWMQPVEQRIDGLAHRSRRLGAALDEACFGSVALGAPFVLQRNRSVDYAKIGI